MEDHNLQWPPNFDAYFYTVAIPWRSWNLRFVRYVPGWLKMGNLYLIQGRVLPIIYNEFIMKGCDKLSCRLQNLKKYFSELQTNL